MRNERLQEIASAKLERELQSVYTQLPIADPARFSGRHELLEHCRTRLAISGMSFVIYGERGLGKTSFANVLLADKKCVIRTAEDGMTFNRLLGEVLSSIDQGWIVTGRRSLDKDMLKGTLKGPAAEYGAEVSSEHEESYELLSRTAVELDVVADALLRRTNDIDAIVIEEFHRLSAPSQRAIMQLMKILADRGGDVRVVAVGTRLLGEELMKDREYKDYIGRSITPVPLPRMTNDELRDIIERRVARGVDVNAPVAAALVWVASGYPALVHRVMYDSSARWVRRNSNEILKSTVGAALLVASPTFLVLQPLVALVMNTFVSLRKAGITVGSTEFLTVLAQYVAQFEREELGGHPIADPQTQRLLREYAITDDEEFDLEALVRRAGLTAIIADRVWKQHATPLVTDNERRLLPGLRSYLRAKLLLSGDGLGSKSVTVADPRGP